MVGGVTGGSAGAMVTVTQGDVQQVDVKAEGKAETCLQRRRSQMTCQLPWSQEVKESHIKGIYATADSKSGGLYHPSRTFLIMAAPFCKEKH